MTQNAGCGLILFRGLDLDIYALPRIPDYKPRDSKFNLSIFKHYEHLRHKYSLMYANVR